MLGRELLARHPHRLALALHAAQSTATGGVGVTPDEEERMVAWFRETIEIVIARGGANDEGDNAPGAEAVWWLIEMDRIRTPEGCCSEARCPFELCAGEAGLVENLRAVAPEYMRTVIAGAAPHEVEELRELLAATDKDLEGYRPLAGPLVDGEVPVAYTMDTMLADLTRVNPTAKQVCSGVEHWSQVFEQISREHYIPPVNRVGAIAWLARVALAGFDTPEAPAPLDGSPIRIASAPAMVAELARIAKRPVSDLLPWMWAAARAREQPPTYNVAAAITKPRSRKARASRAASKARSRRSR